jgi:hypothetical protein
LSFACLVFPHGEPLKSQFNVMAEYHGSKKTGGVPGTLNDTFNLLVIQTLIINCTSSKEDYDYNQEQEQSSVSPVKETFEVHYYFTPCF